MIEYSIILAIPLLLAWMTGSTGRFNPITRNLYFMLLVVFMGLRDRVGADWWGYVNIFNIIQINPEGLSKEYIFMLINLLSGWLEWNVYGVNLACAILFLLGIFAFASTTINPWLSIAAVLPYLGFVIGMSGIRQAAALGIGYVALAYWSRISIVTKLLLIIAATGFHTSAALFMIFMIYDEKSRWLWLKVPFALAFAVLLLTLSGGTDVAEKYNYTYIEKNIESTGAVQHVMLSAIPAALYLIFRKKMKVAGLDNPIVLIGSWGSIIALPLTAVSSTGVDRLSLYFSFVQMWVYPALLAALKEYEGVLIYVISIAVIMIFVIYFNFGKTAFAFLPYRNLITD